MGPGFLEGVYEAALVLELKERQIPFERQRRVPIRYRGTVVGTHVLDLVVDGKVVVELKAVKELADVHKAVVLSYLAATQLGVGLLINFWGTRVVVGRVVR